MRNNMDVFIQCFKAKNKLIWVTTSEEESFLKDLIEVSMSLKKAFPVYAYNFSFGIQKINENDPTSKYYFREGIDELFKDIYRVTRNIKLSEDEIAMKESTESLIISASNNIFVLKDFNLTINNPNVIASIKAILGYSYINYNPIIVLSPINNIPIELRDFFTVINYDVPDEKIIRSMINKTINDGLKNNKLNLVDKDNIDKLINGCKGLRYSEISYIFKLSLFKHGRIDNDEIYRYKLDKLKNSNLLEVREPKMKLSDIGGNNAFKKWINEIIEFSRNTIEDFKEIKPKGYVALGVPGSGKTTMAEAIANSFNQLMLKLDMSKILSSRVGESEHNMASAINLIKANAPCVLLIDEVEKALGGVASSNQSDSGTVSRIVESILELLNDNDLGIFVIMTSNDITQLPPELTRIGRLDAIWYFSFPDEDERSEIFKIHFKNIYKKEVSNNILKYAVEKTEHYTGAEIKEIVKIACRKAYIRSSNVGINLQITTEDINNAVNEIIPLYNSSKEKMHYLESYARNRARFANKKEEEDKPFNTNRHILTIKDFNK